MSIVKLADMSAKAFEHLCFDIIRDLNFHNPKWRTPGADGGRDIEASRDVVDPTFSSRSEKWFIECKKYTSAVSWPTLYEKCAHAEALGADYLFLLTSSSASATCVDRIGEWNRQKRTMIRVWGAHEIDAFLATRPLIRSKHNLGERSTSFDGYYGVALELTKVISTISATHLCERDPSLPIQYANYLAQCWQIREKQINDYRGFAVLPRDIDPAGILGVKVEGERKIFLDLGEALVISWCVFIGSGGPSTLSQSADDITLNIGDDDVKTLLSATSLATVTLLADVDIFASDATPGIITLGRRNG